jgi:hypothetical protein
MADGNLLNERLMNPTIEDMNKICVCYVRSVTILNGHTMTSLD